MKKKLRKWQIVSCCDVEGNVSQKVESLLKFAGDSPQEVQCRCTKWAAEWATMGYEVGFEAPKWMQVC